jgi:hypothetical protein
MEWDRSLIMKRPADVDMQGTCSTTYRPCWCEIDFDSGANYPQTVGETRGQTREEQRLDAEAEVLVQKCGRT